VGKLDTVDLVSESGQVMKVNKLDFQTDPKKFADKGFKPKGAWKKSTPVPETPKPSAAPVDPTKPTWKAPKPQVEGAKG
jgi:hypothetical protein